MAMAKHNTAPVANEGISRRTILFSMPALGLLTGAPVDAGAADTEVMALFKEWRAGFDNLEACGASDAEFQQKEDALMVIHDKLINAESTSHADVLAKLVAFTFDGRHFADDDGASSQRILAEARNAVYGGAA